MGFFDRLFGTESRPAGTAPAHPVPTPAARVSGVPRIPDEIALERYRYLLRTAPPEALERVHAEAFAKLTDAQRATIFAELSAQAPAGEAPRGQDAGSLATAATRSELRQPGTLERSFQGPGFGSMLGGSLLGTVAGFVIGSVIVSALIPDGYGDSQAGDASADGNADQGGNAGVNGDPNATGGGSGDTSGGADSAGGGDFSGGGADFGGAGDFGGGGDFGF